MARPSKTDQELGNLKDWWLEVRAMEAEYNGMFTLLVVPLGRPGLMSYRMTFTPLMESQVNGLGVVALSFSYPNAEQSSFAGTLWRKCISLSRMVDEQYGMRRTGQKNGG